MRNVKSLVELKEFWLALLIPIAVGMVIAIIIAVNSSLSFEFSYEGFNKALEIFKFPLGISALCFPSVALVVSNHRSVQTAIQIRSAESQNSFANYHKHREEFTKLIERLENELSIKFFNTSSFYKKLFPENSIESVSAVSAGINGNISELEAIGTRFKNQVGILSISESVWEKKVKNFYLELFLISCRLHFEPNEAVAIEWQEYFGIERDRGFKVAYKVSKPLHHAFLISRVLEAVGGFCNVACSVSYPSPKKEFLELAAQAFEALLVHEKT